VFFGTYTPRLDEKGRLIFPAKFRDQLAGGLVMTKGRGRSLFVYPMADFLALAEDLQRSPSAGNAARDYRLLMASASDETPDRQGRVTIPQTLRDYAGLTRDVAVLGNGPRVEIWDAAAWNGYVQANDASFAQEPEEVAPRGF
jgi:MraZ protein